jgi:hypothetical protein
MIMSVKENGYAVIGKKVFDGFIPTGALGFKSTGTI